MPAKDDSGLAEHTLAASPAPLGTHRATNEDHFDPGFHDANSFPAPLQFPYVSDVPQQVHQITNDGFLGRSSTHVDCSSAPSQTLLGTYRLTEEALVDPTFYSPNWSSAPSQTLQGSHHFTGEELPGANFDWSFSPFPVPQGPYRFAGGKLWSSAPPLSHEGAYTAVGEGHFEPVLGSVEGATDTVYDEQFNVLHDGAHTAVDDGHFEPILGSVEGATDTMYDEQSNFLRELLGINPNDGLDGFRGLDGFVSTTDHTPEMTNSSGITTESNGTISTSPSLPATQIASNAANTHSSGDRISCTHIGCSVTFGRAGDFRRHIKKHSTPELSCPIEACNYKSYHHDKLREHGHKKHGMTNQLTDRRCR